MNIFKESTVRLVERRVQSAPSCAMLSLCRRRDGSYLRRSRRMLLLLLQPVIRVVGGANSGRRTTPFVDEFLPPLSPSRPAQYAADHPLRQAAPTR